MEYTFLFLPVVSRLLESIYENMKNEAVLLQKLISGSRKSTKIDWGKRITYHKILIHKKVYFVLFSGKQVWHLWRNGRCVIPENFNFLVAKGFPIITYPRN